MNKSKATMNSTIKKQKRVKAQKSSLEDDFIYGVKGLAEFLGVSVPTAMKFRKNLTSYQFSPRIIRFKKSEVLAASSSNNQNA
jgi:hypothetical protein